MDAGVAIKLARLLMKHHNLSDWDFAFSKARRRFGCCKYRGKRIELSRPLVLLNDFDRVKNTILHEIAHALAGPRADHSIMWQVQARSIGCDGQRCYSAAIVKQPWHPWVYICNHCGEKFYRYRMSKRTMFCAVCLRRYGREHATLRIERNAS